MKTFEIAERARARQFWYTPYRTGNLARSVGTVSEYFSESHYKMFDAVRDAPYGKDLNEKPVMEYEKIVRGVKTRGTYVNKHYQWVDKYAAREALEIDMDQGTVRG